MAATLSHHLRAAERKLISAGVDNPQLDTRWLFCHALQLDRAQLLSQSERLLTNEETRQIDALIARRVKREPVARIIGMREFWGLSFGLNEATLEPRPDSETLVETVLKIFATRRGEKLSLLDLGTGTGCLLLSLLHEFPNGTGIGIDIALRAVEQATQNAIALELQIRAQFLIGNWLDGITDKFDVILSNPPYVPAADIPGLMPEVRHFDPMRALDGGTDGLEPYRIVIRHLKNHLNADGLAIFEVGINQAAQVADLFREHGLKNIQTHNDLGGIPRCVSAHIS